MNNFRAIDDDRSVDRPQVERRDLAAPPEEVRQNRVDQPLLDRQVILLAEQHGDAPRQGRPKSAEAVVTEAAVARAQPRQNPLVALEPAQLGVLQKRARGRGFPRTHVVKAQRRIRAAAREHAQGRIDRRARAAREAHACLGRSLDHLDANLSGERTMNVRGQHVRNRFDAALRGVRVEQPHVDVGSDRGPGDDLRAIDVFEFADGQRLQVERG